MSNFEVNIDERAFKNVGVNVNFDERAYGDLLDELTTIVPATHSPRLELTPAPVWGSKVREFLAVASRNEQVLPGSKYNPSQKIISVRASQKVVEANQEVLSGTWRWGADVKGELASFRQRMDEVRWERRALLASFLGGGALAGSYVGGVEGAFAGGVLGLATGMVEEIVRIGRDPYHVAGRRFLKNPDILAKYGQILTYQPR